MLRLKGASETLIVLLRAWDVTCVCGEGGGRPLHKSQESAGLRKDTMSLVSAQYLMYHQLSDVTQENVSIYM